MKNSLGGAERCDGCWLFDVGWGTRWGQWPEILTECGDVAILRGTEQSSRGGCYGPVRRGVVTGVCVLALSALAGASELSIKGAGKFERKTVKYQCDAKRGEDGASGGGVRGGVSE